MVPRGGAKLDDMGVLQGGGVAQLPSQAILAREGVGHGADAFDGDGLGGVGAAVHDGGRAAADFVAREAGEMDALRVDDEIGAHDGAEIGGCVGGLRGEGGEEAEVLDEACEGGAADRASRGGRIVGGGGVGGYGSGVVVLLGGGVGTGVAD